MTTLVVTNDFPPRLGGIESFVAQACGFLDADVAVLTSRTRGREAEERRLDASLGFPIARQGTILLPTPGTLRAAVRLAHQHGCDRVLFGAAAPLGLLACHLRREGLRPVVAISHGHEVWWSQLPGTRQALGRIARDVDALTTISGHTERAIARAVAPGDRPRLVRLAPPVDLERFAPRRVPAGPPTVATAGRLVARKNHATLLRAFRLVRERVPDARLLVASTGPQQARLRRLAGPGVAFVGEVPWAELPAFYARGHAFALPVARRPFDEEGFGMVFAEAAASGLPIVVGRSGGAPETCVDGVSGHVVEPDDVDAIAGDLIALLRDPGRSRRMGLAGRQHVRQFSADRARATLRRTLELP